MAAKAMIRQGYRWRLALIAAMCLGFGLWCLKDGFYTYPRDNQLVEKYEKTIEDYHTKYGQGPEFDKRWAEDAPKLGIPVDQKDLPKKHSGADIILQHVMWLVTLPIGLLFLSSYIRTAGRWVACDDKGVTTSTGQNCPYEAITKLNKIRWRTKGIAEVLYCPPGGGQDSKIVLDDWKYDRAPTQQILKEVEARLKPEQIIGDAPPADPTSAERQAADKHDQDSKAEQ